MKNYKSSLFSKRHYELIAKLIGAWYINGYINEEYLQCVLEDLIDIFLKDNINFNEEKFLKYVEDFIKKILKKD